MRLYKHPNCIDVAMAVLKSFYVKEKDTYKVKIRWINIVSGVLKDMGCPENLEISRKKFMEFQIYE